MEDADRPLSTPDSAFPSGTIDHHYGQTCRANTSTLILRSIFFFLALSSFVTRWPTSSRRGRHGCIGSRKASQLGGLPSGWSSLWRGKASWSITGTGEPCFWMVVKVCLSGVLVRRLQPRVYPCIRVPSFPRTNSKPRSDSAGLSSPLPL